MSKLPIVIADEAIYRLDEALGSAVELRRMPGPDIGPDALVEADALLTRTTTRVDARLLAGAERLRFIGSASAGVDHVDFDALPDALRFAHAPGCNATAVAEWVISVMLLARETGRLWVEKPKVGVVGVGEVGRRLATRLEAIGFETWVCDPPKHEAHELPDHQPLEVLLERCDVLSLHVPLTEGGAWPTRSMLVAAQVDHFVAQGGLLINASRGGVIEFPEREPRAWSPRGSLVIDCWPGEPDIDWRWLQSPALWLGTPHIAGYSVEGKRRATQMVCDALWEGLALPGQRPALGAEPPVRLRDPSPPTLPALCAAISELERDNYALRALFERAGANGGPDPRNLAAYEFLALRRNYALRREFAAHPLPASIAQDTIGVEYARALGFRPPPD